MNPVEAARTFRNLANRTFCIGVGAQKAGTSWLFNYLGCHPEIAMSPIKELHYFDQIYRPDLCSTWRKEFDRQAAESISQLASGETGSITNLQYLIDRVRMNVDPAAYLEYFDRLATHGRSVVGEITPSYSLLPEVGFSALRNTILGAAATPRIVFVMRDPVERFWSQCRFEAPGSFEQSADKVYERALRDPQFLERTRYDVTIARLRAVFGAEELLLLFYEDLFDYATIERLCRFLHVAYVKPDVAIRIHASAAGALDQARRLRAREIFAPVYAFIEKEFADSVPTAWQHSRPGT